MSRTTSLADRFPKKGNWPDTSSMRPISQIAARDAMLSAVEMAIPPEVSARLEEVLTRPQKITLAGILSALEASGVGVASGTADRIRGLLGICEPTADQIWAVVSHSAPQKSSVPHHLARDVDNL